MENSLHKVYEYIDSGELQSAVDVLELTISTNPLNIEAWEAYMQICSSSCELDFLCDRALKVAWANELDRESILDYYYFLRQKLIFCNVKVESQKSVTLELVDQFNISLKEESQHCVKFKYKIAWFFGGVFIISYATLLVLGWSLLSKGDSFGYWILIVLMVSVFIGMRKDKFPVDDYKGKKSVYQAIYFWR